MTVYDDQKNPSSEKYRQIAADDAQMRAITGIGEQEEAAMDARATEENNQFNEWMTAAALKAKEEAIKEGKEFAKEEAGGFVKSQFGGGGPYKFGEAGFDNIVGKTAKRMDRFMLPRNKNPLKWYGAFFIFAALSFIIVAIMQGPASLIVWSNYLRDTHFYANHYILNNRLGKVMVYAWTVDNPQNRNLSVIGNKFANYYQTKLEKAGIKPEFDGTTRLKALTIDTTKPAGERAVAKLKEMGITDDELTPKAGSEGRVRVELIRTDVPQGTSQFRRQAMTGMVNTLDLNNVSGAMGGRLLRLRAGVDLHPMKNLVRDKDEKILDFFKKMSEAERQRIQNGVDPPPTTIEERAVPEGETGGTNDVPAAADELTQAAQGEGSVETRAKSVRAKLSTGYGVIAVAGMACALDAIGDGAVQTTYQNVNLPLERMGMQGISLGDQTISNEGYNTDELEYHIDNLYDPETNTTVFDTDSARVNQGKEPLGYTLSEGSYPTDGTAPYFFGSLSDVIDSTGVGNSLCGALTTTVGGWVFTIIGVGLTATGPLSASIQVGVELIADRIMNVFLDDLIAFLSGDQVDVLAKGAKRGALEDVGALRAANDYVQAFGGTELTKQQAVQLDTEMRGVQADELANGSFFARYLDTTNSKSFASSFIMDMPFLSFASIKNSIGTLPKSYISTFSSTFTNMFSRSAFAEEQLYDYSAITEKYGFTVDEINSAKYDDPFANEEALFDQLAELNDKYGSPCFNTIIDPSTGAYKQTGTSKMASEIPDYCKDRSNTLLTQYRFYLADNLAAITAACYEGIQVEGRDFCAEIGFGDITTTTAGTAAFRVGTFNVLGWEYTEKGGKKASWPSGQKRLVDAFSMIEADGIDVLGLQELQPEQRKKFVEDIAGTEWTMFPDPAKYENYSSSNSIVWKNSEFDFVDSGYQTNLQYFDGAQMDAPWVKLRHKLTGELIYFKNTHDPVDVENEKYRRANAKDHKADAIERMDAGEKVIFVGDFNSNTDVRKDFDGNIKRDNLPYCIMTEGLQVQNAYDTTNGTPGHCPTTKNLGIDHIYHTTNVKMSGWTKDSATEANQISDHPIVFADVVIGSSTGNGDNTSKDGWQWPIAGKTTADVSFPWGERGCGASGCGPHKAIDIPVPYGTEVLAAHDGVVTKATWQGSCGFFYLIQASGTPYYMEYQHMAADPANRLPGQTVKAGEPIGKTGTQCGTGPHLHFGISEENQFNAYTTTPNVTINPLDVLP